MKTPSVPSQLFTLLTMLKANNNREWYQDHKEEYTELQHAFKAYGEQLHRELQQHDPLDKMKVYRPYRDVRFSKDKTPYNVHRSISFFREGKGEYYLRLESHNSSVIIGYWDIDTNDLKRLRQEFEADATEIRDILSEPTFKTHFKGLEPIELKTAPRGFDKEHENIDLIRKKSLLVKKSFTDEEVLRPNFFTKVLTAYQTAYPLLQYIDAVLATDANGEALY